jgi:hypothetical protein
MLMVHGENGARPAPLRDRREPEIEDMTLRRAAPAPMPKP